MPLLDRLEDTYEGFQDTLLGRMVEILCTPMEEGKLQFNYIGYIGHSAHQIIHVPTLAESTAPGQAGAPDRSYALTLTAWILHLLQLADDSQMTEGVVKTCLVAPNTGYAPFFSRALGSSRADPDPLLPRHPCSSLALLDALSKADDSLAATIQPLVRVLRNADSGLATTLTNDSASDALDEMERRMVQLSARVAVSHGWFRTLLSSVCRESKTDWQPGVMQAKPAAAVVVANGVGGASGRGWQRMAGFAPAPIGALPAGGLRELDLAPLVG